MPPRSRVQVEICLETADDAALAESAGADRVELNSALSLGGLSPSPGVLRATRKAVTIPIISMARPRPGGFVYSARDFAALLDDGLFALELGADGVAFGVLSADGSIDPSRCEQAVKVFRQTRADVELVFHRAFEFTPDPMTAMEELIFLGFNRILTSGQQPTAALGASLIGQLITRSAGRIEILPAGGIRPQNVAALVQATGCRQVHGSLGRLTQDPSTVGRPGIALSSDPAGNGHRTTDADSVRQMVSTLQTLESSSRG